MGSKVRATRYGLILAIVAIFLGPLGTLSSNAFAATLPNPTYNYTKSSTIGTGNNDAVQGEGVAADAAGNVYVVGSFVHTATFNNTESFATRNGYITKYTSAGAYVSTTGIADTSNGWVSAESIAIDGSGAMYVAGSWAGTVGFGYTDTLTSSSQGQLPFLIKFNADGSYAWTRTFYAPNGSTTGNAFGVATDNAGHVYYTGTFSGSLLFGMGESGSSNGNGENNSFLTQYDSDGNYVWTKTVDVSATNTSSATTTSVAIDTQGNATVVGYFSGTDTFGGTDTVTAPVVGMFASSYGQNGTYISTKTVVGVNGYAIGVGVSFAPDGSMYIAGGYTGTIAFGGQDTFTDAGNQFNTFVTKYDTNGAYVWTRSFDTSAGGYIQPTNIVVDNDGTAYVSGVYTGTIGYANTGATFTDAGNRSDGYVTSFTADGVYQWTQSFDTSGGGAVQANGLTMTVNRNLYVVGSFGGPVTFGNAETFTDTPVSSSSPFFTRYTVPALIPDAADPSIAAPSVSMPAAVSVSSAVVSASNPARFLSQAATTVPMTSPTATESSESVATSTAKPSDEASRNVAPGATAVAATKSGGNYWWIVAVVIVLVGVVLVVRGITRRGAK